MSSGSVTSLNAARNCRRAPLAFPAMSTGVALGIPAEWAEWINAYLQTLAAIGRPATTIGLRRSHLARLARTINTTPGAVTEGQLTAWFAAQPGWKSAETRRSYRNTIHDFYKWAYQNRRIKLPDILDALPTVPSPKAAPRPTPEFVVRESIDGSDSRVALMLRLAAENGLRRAEVAQVHTDDVGWSAAGLPQLQVHGKGNKIRIIPISEDMAAAILQGAAGHTDSAPSTGWLFPGQVDGHLSPRYVGKLCTKAMPGIWTLHTMRHRFAAQAYRATRNLRAVQELLGHESVATTQRYVPVDDDEMRLAMMGAAA